MKSGHVIQAIEAALKRDHDGCPQVAGSVLREALKMLRMRETRAGRPSPSDGEVNPQVMAGDIPAVKYDANGKMTLIAAGASYVLCRRPGCYPMIRTEREWRALSNTPRSGLQPARVV